MTIWTAFLHCASLGDKHRDGGRAGRLPQGSRATTAVGDALGRGLPQISPASGVLGDPSGPRHSGPSASDPHAAAFGGTAGAVVGRAGAARVVVEHAGQPHQRNRLPRPRATVACRLPRAAHFTMKMPPMTRSGRVHVDLPEFLAEHCHDGSACRPDGSNLVSAGSGTDNCRCDVGRRRRAVAGYTNFAQAVGRRDAESDGSRRTLDQGSCGGILAPDGLSRGGERRLFDEKPASTAPSRNTALAFGEFWPEPPIANKSGQSGSAKLGTCFWTPRLPTVPMRRKRWPNSTASCRPTRSRRRSGLPRPKIWHLRRAPLGFWRIPVGRAPNPGWPHSWIRPTSTFVATRPMDFGICGRFPRPPVKSCGRPSRVNRQNRGPAFLSSLRRPFMHRRAIPR